MPVKKKTAKAKAKAKPAPKAMRVSGVTSKLSLPSKAVWR